MLFACSLAAAAQDVATIIQRSVEANDRDWDADSQYDYCERDRDRSGTKTYDVIMLYGSPYQRVVAMDGKPLSGEQQQAEQRKLEQVTDQRRTESPEKRAERIAKYKEERKRDHTMLAELTKAFDFKLLGHDTLEGHRVYVLEATPRNGYHPPNRDARVLPGMRGKLWIDEDTFQWVKVEASVTRPVAIEGFLAKVQPGTRFELEKAPVTRDIWLTKHFAMKASARVMLMFHHNSEEDDYFFNYHPANRSSPESQGTR